MRAVVDIGLIAVLCLVVCSDLPADEPAATARTGIADSRQLSANEVKPMSANKHTVQKYMDAFGESNHAEVLSCLTDDVEWIVPGMFHVKGKGPFSKEIENEAFVGRPTITVSRLIEENNVVVAEGRVRSTKKVGGVLNVVFCDVFVMRDAKIRHLTSYLMEVKE